MWVYTKPYIYIKYCKKVSNYNENYCNLIYKWDPLNISLFSTKDYFDGYRIKILLPDGMSKFNQKYRPQPFICGVIFHI